MVAYSAIMKHAIAALTLFSSLAFCPLAPAAESGKPLVHPLFCDHMVLQRGDRAPVWGWADPGTEVTVRFGRQKKTALAGTDGQWLVRLSPLAASAEPRELTISTTSGKEARIADVLVGDVWLCSGQSNMEMGIGACEATNDIRTADFPNIRLVTVPKRVAYSPVGLLECRWARCSPETLAAGGWGGFSAAGFYFGRKLHQELKIPIGLIHSSWAERLRRRGPARKRSRLCRTSASGFVSMKKRSRRRPQEPNVTTVLYNGMVAPLLPFAIKGAIWYQGESNADRAYQYRALLRP